MVCVDISIVYVHVSLSTYIETPKKGTRVNLKLRLGQSKLFVFKTEGIYKTIYIYVYICIIYNLYKV